MGVILPLEFTHSGGLEYDGHSGFTHGGDDLRKRAGLSQLSTVNLQTKTKYTHDNFHIMNRAGTYFLVDWSGRH